MPITGREALKFCASSSAKLIMGSGPAIPSEPPSLACPKAQRWRATAAERRGVHPLSGPEHHQAAWRKASLVP